MSRECEIETRINPSQPYIIISAALVRKLNSNDEWESVVEYSYNKKTREVKCVFCLDSSFKEEVLRAISLIKNMAEN